MSVSNKTKLGLVVLFGLVALAVMLTTTQFSNDQNRARGQGDSFNRADLMFMNMMIIHHDQAIKMAELAPNRTDNENVLSLAQNISEAQRRENELMAEWLRSQGYQRPTDGHRMAGMASPKEMNLLEQSSGDEFDTRFAELMIEHHEGGIDMARSEVQNGRSQDLVALAEEMVEVQTNEVNLMRGWLNNWQA